MQQAKHKAKCLYSREILQLEHMLDARMLCIVAALISKVLLMLFFACSTRLKAEIEVEWFAEFFNH